MSLGCIFQGGVMKSRRDQTLLRRAMPFNTFERANFEVIDPMGMNQREMAEFVRIALEHQCAVTVKCRGGLANGRSILSMMQMDAPRGAVLSVEATGEDAGDFLEEIMKMPSLLGGRK